MTFIKDPNIFTKTSDTNNPLRAAGAENIFTDVKNVAGLSLNESSTLLPINRSSSTPDKSPAWGNKVNIKSYKNNNNTTQAIAAVVSQPDLIIQNGSAPSSAAIGSSINISYEVSNQGNADAGYSYTKFYLSKDLNLDSDDIFLDDEYVTSIPVGYYSPESTTLTIDNSIAAGNYYIVFQADGYNNVAESNETNNAVAGLITITAPDLIVQNTSAPSSATVDSTISVSYDVKNQGDADAGYSYTNFYLSQDLTIDDSDKYIGYNYVSDITAGSYSSESTTLSIDSDINPGNYYLIYHVDGDDYVAESNENNNTVGRLITINPVGKPDLIVQNAVAPTSASVGNTVNISYQVKNQGVGDAVASTSKFYLSKDTAYSSDDILLGSDTVNSISAGSTSSETASFTLGNSIATGNYYLLYQADANSSVAESNETNNFANKAIAITKADLIIQNAVVPTSASVGSTVNISYQVKNQGAGNALASTSKFYLSKDTAYSSDDILLGSDAVNAVAVGITSSETASFTLSNSIVTGNYYLLYQADANSSVAESNETNNFANKAIAITKADLIIQNAVVPTSASVGSTVNISYQVKNQGAGNALASTSKFYLSKDTAYSSDDILLGSDAVNAVAVGITSSETASFTLSNSIVTGNYYLLYQADANSSVAESNETNNFANKAIAITKADLIIQNAVAPTSASVGNSVSISYQVKNQGAGNAVASTSKFYLSKDTAYSSDDILLGSDAVNAVAVGITSSETASFTLSNSIVTGNYYLLYQADANSSVAESNETNNFANKAITITKADLIIQNAVAPTSASVGSTVNISYQVKNQGAGNALASTTKFYLSKDTAYSSDDILLGSDAVNSISAGSTSSETASFTLSTGITTGNYYLLYQADANSNVAESNETNNFANKAITLTPAQPDLIIQNISTPSLVDPGDLITLNYQLKNQGAASAGTSTTKFYLSKDATLSNDDALLGSEQSYFYSGLSPGSYSSESYYATISSSTTFGNYYLLFQADAKGEIAESNESNNVTAKAITIAAPDLVIQNASAPANANIGTTIQLSYQLKNQGNGNANYSNTYFYLSKDNSLSNDDIYLSPDLGSSLAPAGVSSESTSVYLSSTIVPSNYYLLYKADGSGSLKESNENNNVVAKAITITAPDLVIVDTSAPTSAAIGTNLEFTYEVKNQGNGNAGTSKTAYSLSRDTTLGNDDDILIGYDTVPIPSLAPSATFSKSISWTIDTTIAAGKYYLMFTADGLKDVAESNENNNTVYITQSITLTPANGGGFNSTTGYGLINAAAAVAKALGQPTFADVPNLGGDDWAADAIKAPEVWAKGYTGQGVIVAVVDSGVDYTHPDLSANIWTNTKEIAGNGKDDDGNGYIDDINGWNFVSKNNDPQDDNNHGTHVAGTIAAVKNDFGVTGIAYNAKIMPIKVLDDTGHGSSSAIINGIKYAVNNGARVINLSLGSPDPDTEEQKAIQYAASKGAIVVMAAANEGDSAPYYPARYADQWGLAVGAVSYNRTLADFSNRAGTTSLAYVTAPGAYLIGDGDANLGIGIYSTFPNNDYGFLDGTSMAAPHVAGVIALMLSANKNLTDAQVRQIVTSTAGNTLVV